MFMCTLLFCYNLLTHDYCLSTSSSCFNVQARELTFVQTWQEQAVGMHREAGVPLLMPLMLLQLPSLPQIWLQGPVPAALWVLWCHRWTRHAHHVTRSPAWNACCLHALRPELVCAFTKCNSSAYRHPPLSHWISLTIHKFKVEITKNFKTEQSIKPMQDPRMIDMVCTFCRWLCFYVWNSCYLHVMSQCNENFEP